MNICKPRIIHERSNIIPIQPQSPTYKKEKNDIENEYSLMQNIFDPSKSSPPNEFLLKLQLRMSLYNSLINEERRIIE
jgi:hypothetical protein